MTSSLLPYPTGKARLTCCTGLLLAAGIAVVLLWLLTGWLAVFWGDGMWKEFDVAHGAVQFWMRNRMPDDWRTEWPNHGLSVGWKPLQFSLVPVLTWTNRTVMVRLPLWCPAAVFLGLGIVLSRKARLQNVGHTCAQCQYDLTGNVSGRCPECGTAISPIKANEK